MTKLADKEHVRSKPVKAEHVRWGSLVILSLVTLATICIVSYSQVATPVVLDAIDDMGAEIPALSGLVLAMSSPVMSVSIAVLFLTVLVAKEYYIKHPVLCLVINNVALIVILVSFCIYRDAIAYPLLDLIQRLSG